MTSNLSKKIKKNQQQDPLRKTRGTYNQGEMDGLSVSHLPANEGAAAILARLIVYRSAARCRPVLVSLGIERNEIQKNSFSTVYYHLPIFNI